MYNFERHPNLVLKLKVPFALKDGEKIALDYAPTRKADGTVLVPAFIEGFGGKTEAFEGKKYFTLESLDCYKKFDEMGCIILDKEIDLSSINREDDLDLMLRWMGEFIFDIEKIPLAKYYAPATPEERAGFKRVGEDIKARLLARNNQHPYLVSKPGILDALHEIYRTNSNPTLKGYMDVLIQSADEVFSKEIFKTNEQITAFLKPIEDPQLDGYDVGGRANFQNTFGTAAYHLATAYQLTRDTKYAKLAYLILKEMLRFPHWGPGHFLNTAMATYDYCFAYDWLYNIWCELGYNLKDITCGIYSHGVLQSYNSMIYDKCDYPSPRQGTGWRFKLKPDNWNAVCNTGAILGAAMLICEGKGGYITDQILDICTEQIGASLSSLTQDGLVLKQYAPDGSYVESKSYWSYGTSNLFKTIATLHSMLGTDLGLHYTWGLDKTCYYAIQTESAEYVGWNYHDGAIDEQNTCSFYKFGYISGDKNLYAIRREHLRRGKEISIDDLLYDPELLGEEIPKIDALPLDYLMEGIDGFTVRSGWEIGSIYAGLLGGKNFGGHTQIDAGTFVYHNHGKLWFTDLGSDYYNLPGGYFSNNNLFRRNAEGNNTLFLSSLPHGQVTMSISPITEWRSSDAASYAILDTTSAYGEKAVKVTRGMLLTADRKTWVLRDEAEFKEAENACWVANFESAKIGCEIAEDGKSCKMSYEDGTAINVYLFSDADVKFEIVSCYDFLLAETQPKVEGEYDRSAYSRLLVRFNGRKKFNLSIVVEPVGDAAQYALPTAEWKNL
ncbi:MAG: heparinase II/III family protein [Clostridia bacterium]|nr:heparinase II/III family protein [Clostridia bacterium]